MGNINSEQLSLLEQQLVESQAREKVLHGWIEDHCRFDSLNMDLSNWRKFVEEYRAFPTDDTALRAALKAERERYKKAFQKMRNVAAGYSNHCEDRGSTRRLEREFTEAEEMFRELEDE